MRKLVSTLQITMCLLASFFVHANNGQTALVYPIEIEFIKIDGNSSDWPNDITENPVDIDFFGNELPDKDDFSAFFKTAYSPKDNRLFVLLVVNDESHIQSSSDSNAWSQQDSVILYLDPVHSIQGSGSSLYLSMSDNQFMLNAEQHWDPSVNKRDWGTVNGKMQRVGNITTYEWQFTLEQNFKTIRTLGFDVLITDRDADDSDESQSTMVMWGPFTGKSRSPTRIGDLLLVGENKELGVLEGKIQWDPSVEADNQFKRVRITSLNYPDFWLHTLVDEEGNYQVKLPAGEYLVSNAYSTLGNPWTGLLIPDPNVSVAATIKGNETVTAPTLITNIIPEPDLLEEKGALFSFNKSKTADLDKVVETYMQHYKVPGASVVLIKDRQLVYSNVYGVSNNYTGTKVTSETLFEAASITKAVFAFAVNRLAEQGVIDLDKPLFEYLPFEAIAHDERYKKITARLVLSHQTGFPNWAWMNDDGKLDIKFYPGIKFGYSGEGFEYLGRVVSHITDKSLEQVIEEEVLQPLNVKNTYFSDSQDIRNKVSHGHFATYATPIDIPAAIGVAHSMHTEAKSFSQFMLGLIQQKGLSTEGYKSMFEPQVEVPIKPEEGDWPWPTRYGLGFSLMNTPHGITYGHGGNNGDFTCDFVIYKEQGLGFAIFTNSDSGTAFHKKMHEYLIWGKSYNAVYKTD